MEYPADDPNGELLRAAAGAYRGALARQRGDASATTGTSAGQASLSTPVASTLRVLGLLEPADPGRDAGHATGGADLEREDGSPADETVRVANPLEVFERVVAPLYEQIQALQRAASAWGSVVDDLSRDWPREQISRGDQVEAHSRSEVPELLGKLLAGARTDIATALPRIEDADPTDMSAAWAHWRSAAERGVQVRSMFQHSVRTHRAVASHVTHAATHGAEVRTVDEIFRLLIVIDREIAVVPDLEHRGGILVIRRSSLVAYFADIFDRMWARGTPYMARTGDVLEDVAAEQRDMMLQLLAEGCSDRASAKRLGISPRTFAAYIAALKDEMGVETRYQLGHALGVLEGMERAARDRPGH